MADYTEDYLLGKRIKILQPQNGYRAAIDAVFLAAAGQQIGAGDTVLDAGSGTGAVSLCLAARFVDRKPVITGVEIQPELAALANQSVQRNGFDNVRYLNADFFASDLPFCSFDHVFCNPPYLPVGMPASPRRSKAAAHNLAAVDLSAWIELCIKMMRPKGCFYMINRADALAEILQTLNGRLGEIAIIPLASKAGQPAKRVIVRARKDSRAPLTLLPPFAVHEPDGRYTAAARAVLCEAQGL